MAIEIIEQHELPETYYRMTCPRCKTIFKFQQTDVDVDRDGSYIICPECGYYMVPDISQEDE